MIPRTVQVGTKQLVSMSDIQFKLLVRNSIIGFLNNHLR